MSTTPAITVFVRHSVDCKYRQDEFCRRCKCRKHLRWTHAGKQHRRTANTRSWEQAEQVKRQIEDQLAGRNPTVPEKGKPLFEATALFIKDKQVQGLSDDVIKKYTRLLRRLQSYCDSQSIFNVQGITREVITEFCADWPEQYPSSITRAKLRERLRSFLRYCFDAQWLERIPPVPKFKTEDEPETQPLTPGEYARLIDAVYVTVGNGDPRRQTTKNGGGRWQYKDAAKWQHAVYTFLQTMRWTGLSIGDTMRLKRSALEFDGAKGLYKVTTKRKKTGVPVSVPIPEAVALDLLKVANENPEYFFWSGSGKVQSATTNWGQRYIAPVFKEAGIVSEGNMLSHRLRDTFAVDLLSRGVPMEEVSKLLGHTSIRTTEKSYAKSSKSRQDRVDTLVSGTWPKPNKPGRPGRKPQRAAP